MNYRDKIVSLRMCSKLYEKCLKYLAILNDVHSYGGRNFYFGKDPDGFSVNKFSFADLVEYALKKILSEKVPELM